MQEVSWDGGLISTEVLDASIRLTCSAGWQLEVAVETGGDSFIRQCGLEPMGDRLLLSLVCENNRGGTFCYAQIRCLAPGGRLLWGLMVDPYGGDFGMLRLTEGLAVLAGWGSLSHRGLQDMEARLLDPDTGEVLKTHTVPVVKDLRKRNWEYHPYIYGHGGPLYFGVRATATAAPEVPAEWGRPV